MVIVEFIAEYNCVQQHNLIPDQNPKVFIAWRLDINLGRPPW